MSAAVPRGGLLDHVGLIEFPYGCWFAHQIDPRTVILSSVQYPTKATN
jgi:hypothetical protein